MWAGTECGQTNLNAWPCLLLLPAISIELFGSPIDLFYVQQPKFKKMPPAAVQASSNYEFDQV